jgi:cyclopropane-fatty-acyl-phospholipid synthase
MPVTVRAEREADLPLPHRGQWPGLDEIPRAPIRAVIARAVFRWAVKRMDVRVELPGGKVLGRGGPGAPTLKIVRPKEFFRRLGADIRIGSGESYMVGAWTTDDLVGVLTAAATRFARPLGPLTRWVRSWLDARHVRAEDNDRAGAAENISRHYDLSNDLFALFLDETMSYSAGWFEPGDTLADAQRRKIDGVLDFAGVGPGTRMLEIGTGWGGLAIRAADRGAQVTTVTIAAEQQALAAERIAAAGLSDRVDVQLRDYRDTDGRYDAVVSVEMIEAVGARYWPTYFAALDRLCAQGGRVALQAITMPHERYLNVRNSYTWINKYIFPGGRIPSLKAIEKVLREHTSLRLIARRDLGPHYAETLRQWRLRFAARWEDVHKLGFDQTFRRMWEFYLAYCEVGFRTGYLDVSQLALARPA